MADYLHFRGNITATIDRDQMLGPDTGGRYLAIKAIDYDPATDVTTASLRAILPDEFRERVMKLAGGQSERERIRAVFNG